MLFLDSTSTANNIGVKAYGVVAIAFAARTAEMLHLQWSDFELMTVGDKGGRGYRIHYRRGKRQTSYTEDEEYCTVTGDVEVQILDEYMDCFAHRDQFGRFFRSLMMKDGRITGTKKIIGVHTMSQYAQIVAKSYLALADWKKYTGHCWRRTSITWAAASGLSLAQLKVLSDHRSDSVVQGYIDRSDCMRGLVNERVSMASSSSSSRRRGRAENETDHEDSPPIVRQRTSAGMLPSGQQVTFFISTVPHNAENM